MRWKWLRIAFFLVAIWLGGRTTDARNGRNNSGPSRHHSRCASGSSASSTPAEEKGENRKKRYGVSAFGRLFGGGKGGCNNSDEHNNKRGDVPPPPTPSGRGYEGGFGMADEEKEAIETVNRLLTAGDPLGAAEQLKRLQKTLEGLPMPQEVRNVKLIQLGGLIGNLLCSQGKWQEAEDSLRSSLSIFGWPDSAKPLVIGPPRPILNIFHLGLLENLAVVLSGQGRHVPSEALWRECITRRKSMGSMFSGTGGDSPGHAVSPTGTTEFGESVSGGAPPSLQVIFPAQEGLAVSLANQGRFKEASALSQAALESRLRLLRGANPSDGTLVPTAVAFGLVRCRAQLATWLMTLSKFEEAEELLLDALEIVAHRRAEFDGKISCSDLLVTLGTCLADQGRVVEAQEAHLRALQETKTGDVSTSFSSLPIVLSSIAVGAQEMSHIISDQTLGTAAINQGPSEPGSALIMDVLLKASLAKARTTLSHDHARLAVVLSHAAHAPLCVGKLDQARELLMEALELLPKDSTIDCTLAEVLYKLGLVQCLSRREVEAEGLLRHALAIHSSSDVNNAPCAASDMVALAKVLIIQGQKLGFGKGDRGRPLVDEAYSLLKDAFESHKNVFGSKSKQCTALRYIMGVTSSLRGEKSTSEQYFRQGLELAKRHRCCGIVGANCELGLASLLLGGGGPTGLGKPGGTGETSGLPLPPNQEEEALELLRSAISKLGYIHPDSSAVALFAGQRLLSSGREAEAEEFLRFVADKPVDGPDVVSSLVLLGKVLSMQDKNSEAEESTRRAVSMAERISGEGTIFAARAMLCLADVLGSMPGRWSEAQDLYKRATEILKRDKDDDPSLLP